VALLYGIANDGDAMANAARIALSHPLTARVLKEQMNHTAHVRMGEALAGRAPARSPELHVDYGTYISHARDHLATCILERTGDIGIRLVTPHGTLEV